MKAGPQLVPNSSCWNEYVPMVNEHMAPASDGRLTRDQEGARKMDGAGRPVPSLAIIGRLDGAGSLGVIANRSRSCIQ